MSDYQKQKARAQELQRQKEEALKLEQAERAEREKQRLRDEKEKRLKLEASIREARTRELIAANAKLTASSSAAPVASGANAKAVEVGYDPFAEDERRPPSLLSASAGAGPSKPRLKSSAVSGERRGSPAMNGSTKRSQGPNGERKKKEREKAASPPPATRKERRAKEFMEEAKKHAGKKNDLFSVSNLFKPPPGASRGGGAMKMGRAGSINGTERKKGNGEVDAGRRNRPLVDAKPVSREGKDRRSRSPVKPATAPSATNKNGNGRPNPARRRSPSSDDSSTTSEDSPPRRRPGSPEIDPCDISATIRGLFARPGQAPKRHYDDESDSDMEAGLSDVEREETRAAKIARREDEVAQREEEERKRIKERNKRDRERLAGITPGKK